MAFPSSSKTTSMPFFVAMNPGWRDPKRIVPLQAAASCEESMLTVSPAKLGQASTWTTAWTSDCPVSTSGLGLTITQEAAGRDRRFDVHTGARHLDRCGDT